MADYNLEVTLSKAWGELKALDPQVVSKNSDAVLFQEEEQFRLCSFGQDLTINFHDEQIFDWQQQPLEIRRSILTLHYLTTADGTKLSTEWISFKELPAGQIYSEPFSRRALLPLVASFGDDLELFSLASERLAGEMTRVGDCAYKFSPFPRVPVIAAIWSGDDEFPANAAMLFSAGASHYLPTEDYAVLASVIVQDLRDTSRKIKKP